MRMIVRPKNPPYWPKARQFPWNIPLNIIQPSTIKR